MRRAACTVAAAVLLLAGCSATAPSSSGSQFGPFAGYLWHGDVHQVGAVIRVPRLDGASGNGVAGSWIGAQGTSAATGRSGPFFQIGVNEDWNGIEATSSHYYVFWSSNGVDFHPQWLFDVNPGDAIELSLHVVAGRLVMDARDRRSGRHATLSRGLAGADEFNQAAWHQEDVADAQSGRPFTYPQLTPVRFSGLRVDDQRPAVSALQEIWMTTDDAYYGPKLSGNGFTVSRIRPSAAALRYERIAVPEDLQTYLWNAQSASWSSATPPRVIRAASLGYLRVLGRNLGALRAYRWPRSVRAAIAGLVDEQRRREGELRRLARQTTAYLDAFRRLRARNWGTVVRAELHMAVFDPDSSSIVSYLKSHRG
jgi:hypothetical protein